MTSPRHTPPRRTAQHAAPQPLADFLATLPAVYVGAGALLTNAAGEVLLVNPTYKPGWEIPGGAMDPDEYPRETLRREIGEELGLEIEPGRLLVTDFILARPERPRPSTMHVYECGVLDEAQQESIRLQVEELSEYRFVPEDELSQYLPGRLLRRMREALLRLYFGGVADLENGYEPGTAREQLPLSDTPEID